MGGERRCASCGAGRIVLFFELEGVPVNSVLLMRTREEAAGIARGDIRLGFCEDCGFIGNLAFDEALPQYSPRYEETQGFSGTFNEFHRALAADLIDKHNLRGKSVIEVGCGKGEFLHLLCEMGGNRGLGFDPGYRPDRDAGRRRAEVEFVQDFYSEKYAHHTADFLCSKMTLEHIRDVAGFVARVRRALEPSPEATVFFQVPNARKVLQQGGFWDVYYEHCSYFSAGSLERLFRRQSFVVTDVYTGYDGQYLMIEARCGTEADRPATTGEEVSELRQDVERFRVLVEQKRGTWRDWARQAVERGERIVVWGGGSKAVAFLAALEVNGAIPYAVDINPHRQGTFLPGGGQEIVAPEFLRQYRPQRVIVMNPVYREEISRDLVRLGVGAELVSVEDF